MRLLLGFTLLLGAVAPGCGDDGSSDSSSSTSDTTTTGSTSTTTAPATGGSSSSGQGEGPGSTTLVGTSTGFGGSSSTTASDTTGPGSESSSSGSSTGERQQVCELGCVTEYACSADWKSEEECTAACQANLVEAGLFSPACLAAWEDLAVCLGTLTCEEYEEWQAPAALPYPCSESDILLQIECKGQ